ncbi:stimulus-sensing domain-containing protein [Emcibacter sp. SYSU 3D8]|uniref:stimulus-sensing domain-containing protein n=1 Tax=Emcibacter sp. SYSU 3D8 TaxID=3133969 RepID=UPI0031FF3827
MNVRKFFGGRDNRPSDPASAYYRLPFSGLTGRILILNVIGLAVLVGGILYVNQYRTGLIETRLTAMRSQAEMLAGALAETVESETETGELKKERAAALLRRLSADRSDRVRLFETDGTLALDTRKLNPSTSVVTIPLPPPGQREQVSMLQALWAKFRAFSIRTLSSDPQYPLYEERYDQTAADYPEVLKALTGEFDEMVRTKPDRSLVLSVAVPVAHFRHVLGALLVSVETTEIEEVVRQERLAILEIFLVALSVTMLLSILLAGTIARPVQRLAAFAHTVRQGRGRQAIVPDFSRRHDEVGDLSRALRDMTLALYHRIDTIEGFAADVAHEVKNPLTSLRSAVETMERTQNPDHKAKLMTIIKHDIDRLTRLISDISNASRLDAELLRADMQEIDVPSMMREIIGVFAAHDDKVIAGTSKRRPRIVLDVEGYNLVVYGIESHLGQVMRNLIDNAISFSPPGGVITISVRRNRDTVFISVDDEGPGIPDERLDEIFERFYSERPEEEGFGSHSGLGLNISRQIITVHDGAIRAENRYGPEGEVGPPLGARFTITLPAVGPPQKAPKPSDRSSTEIS